MYGQSGAGGMGASGGAHQSSPDQPQGNPVGMALQIQQIEQQRRMNDAANAGTGFIGNALSQAFGLSWSPKKAMEEQLKYNKNIMALQNKYQQEAAAQSQQYRDWETDRKSVV